MDTSNILASLRAERDRINQAIAALEALDGTAVAVKAINTPKAAQTNVSAATKKRVMSPAGRQRIAEAQRARWAAKKKAAKPEASAKQVVPKKSAPKTTKRVISPESRKKMAEAQQKRWAKKKKTAKAAQKAARLQLHL